MPRYDRLRRVLSLATLERSRAELRGRWARVLAVAVAVVYGFVALQVGLMLTFGPTGQTTTTIFLLWGNGYAAWWNYPALLVIFPGGLLALPFFATVVMVLVSIGVGIGMTVGIVLTARLLRKRRRELRGPASTGAAVGLTPAMIALVTLGACCSTTAAATAGIGALAQASGTTLDTVLLNNWYIGVFQLVVLWVALVAQEQLLAVYGVLLGASPDAPAVTPSGPFVVRRGMALGARVLLVVAGVTWALAGLGQWGFGGAYGPPWSNDTGWVLSHGVLAGWAVLMGFSPELLGTLGRPRPTARAFRGVLAATALSLVVGLPAGLASTGLHGWANELLAAAGASASSGAISAGALGPSALALRWGVQFLFLGGFALAAAFAPERLARAMSDRSERTAVATRVRPPAPTRGADAVAPGAASTSSSVSSAPVRL